MASPRYPCRALLGQCCRQKLRICQILQPQSPVDDRQAGLMRQQLTHRDIALAGRGELWPISGYSLLVVQQPAGVDMRHRQ
nr:hypothetical protein [Streptomyces parvulus]